MKDITGRNIKYNLSKISEENICSDKTPEMENHSSVQVHDVTADISDSSEMTGIEAEDFVNRKASKKQALKQKFPFPRFIPQFVDHNRETMV